MCVIIRHVRPTALDPLKLTKGRSATCRSRSSTMMARNITPHSLNGSSCHTVLNTMTRNRAGTGSAYSRWSFGWPYGGQQNACIFSSNILGAATPSFFVCLFCYSWDCRQEGTRHQNNICVCESYIGKPIGTHAVPQFTTGMAKQCNADITRKHWTSFHQFELHDHAC